MGLFGLIPSGYREGIIEQYNEEPMNQVNVKVKEFFLKKSELKMVDYQMLLFLHSGETTDLNLNSVIEKASSLVLKQNPVILVEVTRIDNEIVFIYKKIHESQMRKLNEGALIGSLLYFE